MMWAALVAATHRFENEGEPGSAIIANTLAWVGGYCETAPTAHDILPNVPMIGTRYDEKDPDHQTGPLNAANPGSPPT